MTKSKGFSLVEVVVAVALVGGVLAMIMSAVVMLNRAVANERVVAFAPTAGSATQWGYLDIRDTSGQPIFPSFTNAPSRLADAQADALWRQLQEIYEQSYVVTAMDRYLIIDFTARDSQNQSSPWFIGSKGYISANSDGSRFPPLTRQQLLGFDSSQTPSLMAELSRRFGSGSLLGTFAVWDPSAINNIDTNTLRQATVFFLDTQDRIIAILRMRAWQFVSGNANPYRYYEVNLARIRWGLATGATAAPAAVDQPWQIASGNSSNFVQDYSYRFTEDRRFPQDLINPPSNAQLDEWAGTGSGTFPNTNPVTTNLAGLNNFIRLAGAGEDYASGAGASRAQVSLTPVGNNVSQLRAPVDEWHIILPDPSLSQSEDRAGLRVAAMKNGDNFDATLDRSFRRQGKYVGAFSVYP